MTDWQKEIRGCGLDAYRRHDGITGQSLCSPRFPQLLHSWPTLSFSLHFPSFFVFSVFLCFYISLILFFFLSSVQHFKASGLSFFFSFQDDSFRMNFFSLEFSLDLASNQISLDFFCLMLQYLLLILLYFLLFRYSFKKFRVFSTSRYISLFSISIIARFDQSCKNFYLL